MQRAGGEVDVRGRSWQWDPRALSLSGYEVTIGIADIRRNSHPLRASS